jgi:hypothetical protein
VANGRGGSDDVSGDGIVVTMTVGACDADADADARPRDVGSDTRFATARG